METINFFDMFGVAEQPTEKSKEKKATKSTTKQLEYEMPITIYSGFREPLSLNEKDFGKDKVSVKEIKQAICSRCAEFTEGLLDLETINEKERLFGASFNSSKMIRKGTIHVTKESKMQYGSYQFELSAIMSDEVCDLDIAIIQEFVNKTAPEFGEAKNIQLYADENTIVPIPGFTSAGNAKSFPITIHILGREQFEITEEMYHNCDDSKKTATTKDGISEKIIQKLITKTYKEFDEKHQLLLHKKGENCYILLWKKGDSLPQKKLQLYPTTAVISLIFTKIELSPDMFGGEEEVSESDLITFLSKDYPEYSKERTNLIYDKKKNLIIPVLKGSTKGAELVTNPVREAELMARPYALFEKEMEGHLFRCENKEEAYYSVEKVSNHAAGNFRLKIPKVPYQIFHVAKEFFRYVTVEYNSEAMLQLFWNKEKEEYFWYCPVQRVSFTSVQCERNYELEMDERFILVGDFHSHGRIQCSFSETDNADEKGTRFYGVFHSYTSDSTQQEPCFDLRIGCGGYFYPINQLELFMPKMEQVETDIHFEEFLQNIKF